MIRFISFSSRGVAKAFSAACQQRGFATAAESMNPSKDYYQILGVEPSSTPDEIKEAYRNLAKKYHPDVNIAGSEYEPNLDKFREVAEAYSVLSTYDTKLAYDKEKKKSPDAVFKTATDKIVRERDPKTGQPIVDEPTPGSYKDIRLRELRKERETWGLDYLGGVKGGLPKKDGGMKRGIGAGAVGEFLNECVINEKRLEQPDDHSVTPREQKYFHDWTLEDKVRTPVHDIWRPLEVDEKHRFRQKRRGEWWYLFTTVMALYLGKVIKNMNKTHHRKFRENAFKLEKNLGQYMTNYGVTLKKA
eukprot:TRINITY_DN3868_c0_g1_i1.p1 TRINITY_DN3868_c0_g1~~TRINITY_DN3868_c0_g1_i1.p1  ORF type:complete len:303 (+),score=53.67 TRINITY_DN3868_c0_g1_i1:31-939(+)